MLEYCFICDEETGNAGRGEDSLYCDTCDRGPFCAGCFEDHFKSEEECNDKLLTKTEVNKMTLPQAIENKGDSER